MDEKKIVLGAPYKDTITGFKGVAVGHCVYLTGCNQTLLKPTKTKDSSKMPSGQWIDDQRLVRSKGKVVVLDNGATPGCDKEAPKV